VDRNRPTVEFPDVVFRETGVEPADLQFQASVVEAPRVLEVALGGDDEDRAVVPVDGQIGLVASLTWPGSVR